MDNSTNRLTPLPTTVQRFRKGDKIMVWGRPAVMTGLLYNSANIIRFTHTDLAGGSDSIISHFFDGQNQHVQLIEAAPQED